MHLNLCASLASLTARLKKLSGERFAGTKRTDMWQRGALKRWRARMRLEGLAELMNILVTFAVEAEFTPWRNRRKFRRLPGDWPRFEAKFGGARVRAVLTGMGGAHPRGAARRMLPDRPDICISTVLAGPLPKRQPPRVFLGRALVAESVGT